MKKILLLVLLIASLFAQGQITTPVIRANFGVEADLKANYYDGFVQAGNDDWFGNGDPGPGTFIIDTTGAYFLKQKYLSTPAFRMTPFFRNMRFPQFSIVNGMMLIDAVYIRDHHGDDSTVFASGSNKNGMTPADWSCPVSQGIPDKNDILDMGMHVRRAGPNGTDSLWMFGSLSLDNTTGNRYFDFEMYQTDIVYNRPTLSFTGYGPDFGHTTWTFDASGNVLTAGDIIFTAEYSSADLSNIEARIWINKNDLAITPAAFSWAPGPVFDGANSGSTYGYAAIIPKTAGGFYTGLQCGNNTWGGPFQIVLQNNSLATNYSARQLMEFSVNLSKLGLDPLVNQGDPCKMPFRRILVKSRASTSFTAELKDFVGPFSFFRAPALGASADIPYFCGSSDVRTLTVDNALPQSLYTWTTPDGHIVGDNVGPTIDIDLPGTYIVSQELMDSCGSTYARDTIVVPQNNNCIVLNTSILSFKGMQRDNVTDLFWQIGNNYDVQYYQLERSTDNTTWNSIYKRDLLPKEEIASYSYTDEERLTASMVFYRVKVVDRNGSVKFSRIIAISKDPNLAAGIKVLPNPVRTNYNLLVTSPETGKASIEIADLAGHVIERMEIQVQKGSLVVPLVNPSSRPYGMYLVRLNLEGNVYSTKLLYVK